MAPKKKKTKVKNKGKNKEKKLESIYLENSTQLSDNQGEQTALQTVSYCLNPSIDKIFEIFKDDDLMRFLLIQSIHERDIEALEFIDSFYSINNIKDNYYIIYKSISGIISSFESKDKQIIKYLKKIKNIEHNGELKSEEELSSLKNKHDLSLSYLSSYKKYKSIEIPEHEELMDISSDSKQNLLILFKFLFKVIIGKHTINNSEGSKLINSLELLIKSIVDETIFDEIDKLFFSIKERSLIYNKISNLTMGLNLSIRYKNSFENDLIILSKGTPKNENLLLGKIQMHESYSKFSIEVGFFNIGFKHLEMAHKIFIEEIKPYIPKVEYRKYKGLGSILSMYVSAIVKFDINDAKKYFEELKDLFTYNTSFEEYFFSVGNNSLSAKKIINEDFNTLIFATNPRANFDEEISIQSFNDYLTIKENILNNNYDKSFETIKQIVENKEHDLIYKYFLLVNFLSFCTATEIVDPERILTFYKDLIQKHPYLDNKCQIALKYYEFKLYMQCGKIDEAYQLLLNLPNTGIKYELKYIKAAGELYVYTLIDNKQYEDAQKYIEDHYIGDIHEKSKLNILIKILREQKLKAEQAQSEGHAKIDKDENNSADESEIEDIVSLLDITVDEEDFNEIQHNNKDNERIYHQAIHAYHQQRKSQLAKNSFEVASSVKTWKINDQIISSNSTIKVESKSNFYVKIDSSIADKFEIKVLDKKIIHAIEKGFVSRKCNDIGMKQIGNQLIELVILGFGGDTRLYTQELFKNTNGDTLIIFNKVGDHATIKRVVNSKTTLKTIIVECGSLEDIKDRELETTEHGNDSMINDDHHNNDDEDIVVMGSDE